MKTRKNFLRVVCAFALLTGATSLQAQNNAPTYDKALADSLGAVANGMKAYMLVILKTGPATITDSVARAALFAGHFRNIGKMAAEGKLVVAGPMQKNDKTYRGIFILNVKTKEEALKLMEGDDAIKAGIFDTEVFTWYGSAALPMYLPFHDRIEKK
jgi:uncharacterized protein YciI